MSAATATTVASAGVQMLLHLLPSMRQMGQVEGMMHFSGFHGLDTSQGEACGLAARINFENHGLHCALFNPAVFQANAERFHPMDHGSLVGQQQPCPFL
jgi:hypothetical protein